MSFQPEKQIIPVLNLNTETSEIKKVLMVNNSNSNNGHRIRYPVVGLGWIELETV